MTEINELTERIIGAAVEVHRQLGPGLLESAYSKCFGMELGKGDLRFQRQLEVPIIYDGVRVDAGYRLDFLVERRVVVELKAVQALNPVFTAQVLTYLKLGGWELGLLINFNVRYMGDGAIRRLVNGYSGPLPGGAKADTS